jgi:hypothetical protein
MMSHYDCSTQTAATLINPAFNVAADDWPATNAIDGELSMTSETGVGMTWTADIVNGPKLVSSVVLYVASNMTSERKGLSNVNVLIDGELCGQIPFNEDPDTQYTVECPIHLSGTQVKLETTLDDHFLALGGIAVLGCPENRVSFEQEIASLEETKTTLEGYNADLQIQITTITNQTTEIINNLTSQVSTLEAERDQLESCTQSLNTIRSTFENGHGEYELQPTQGYCVRSSDNDYDTDLSNVMLNTSESVYECAAACNADEECIAFDYRLNDGECYYFKYDPVAPYVGNGDEAY